MVVLVTGTGRSGSSFYARCLYVMGGYFGRHITTEYSQLNLAGTYDNRLVKRINRRLMDLIEPNTRAKTGTLNKAYWKVLAHDKAKKWYDYHTFYDNRSWRFPAEKTVKDIDMITAAAMEYLLCDLDRAGVGVTKQEMIYPFPFWKEMLESLGIEYKVVGVFRNPLSYASSRMNFARKTGMPVRDEKAWVKDWLIINRLLLEYASGVEAGGVEVLWNNFDWPQEYMMKRLEENCSSLGLKFDREKSKGLFDPGQKHYNDNVEESLKSALDAETFEVYEKLLERSG